MSNEIKNVKLAGVKRESSDITGIGGWLAVAIAGLGLMSFILLCATALLLGSFTTPHSWSGDISLYLTVVFLPVIAIGLMISIVLILRRKKIALKAILTTYCLTILAIVTVRTTIVAETIDSRSTSNYDYEYVTQANPKLTAGNKFAIVMQGVSVMLGMSFLATLVLVYFRQSERVKNTLVE